MYVHCTYLCFGISFPWLKLRKTEVEYEYLRNFQFLIEFEAFFLEKGPYGRTVTNRSGFVSILNMVHVSLLLFIPFCGTIGMFSVLSMGACIRFWALLPYALLYFSNAYRTAFWRVARCCSFCVLLILFWSLVKGADDLKVGWEHKRGTFVGNVTNVISQPLQRSMRNFCSNKKLKTIRTRVEIILGFNESYRFYWFNPMSIHIEHCIRRVMTYMHENGPIYLLKSMNDI